MSRISGILAKLFRVVRPYFTSWTWTPLIVASFAILYPSLRFSSIRYAWLRSDYCHTLSCILTKKMLECIWIKFHIFMWKLLNDSILIQICQADQSCQTSPNRRGFVVFVCVFRPKKWEFVRFPCIYSTCFMPGARPRFKYADRNLNSSGRCD